MPWKSLQKKSKSQHVWVLLMGGSIFEHSDAIRISNRRRRGDEKNYKPKDIVLEELLWQRDFSAITNFFERLNATVWRCIPTSFQCSRNYALQLIMEFFQIDDTKVTGEQNHFVLYWGGHGMVDTGNWAFTHEGEITCRDVVDAWNSRVVVNTYDDISSLTIISDTCHSGAWIEPLKEANIPRLAYQAACRADEIAYAVNDGNIPRSLLMRKFIIEQEKPVEWYLWTCCDQHPVHLCDYENTEDGQDLNAGQRRGLVKGLPFYFFTVNQHWNSSKKLLTKERKAELHRLAEYGVFLDDM